MGKPHSHLLEGTIERLRPWSYVGGSILVRRGRSSLGRRVVHRVRLAVHQLAKLNGDRRHGSRRWRLGSAGEGARTPELHHVDSVALLSNGTRVAEHVAAGVLASRAWDLVLLADSATHDAADKELGHGDEDEDGEVGQQVCENDLELLLALSAEVVPM